VSPRNSLIPLILRKNSYFRIGNYLAPKMYLRMDTS